MNLTQRFGAYANAFEQAFKSDDWSVVEPYFTEDAVYEIHGGPPFGGRHEGRAAVLAYFKQVLDSLDRRFDSRELELLEGPVERDGSVWIRWRGTYRLAGAPEFSLEGEESAHFEGDRIRRLEDRLDANTAATARSWLEAHAAKLPTPKG